MVNSIYEAQADHIVKNILGLNHINIPAIKALELNATNSEKANMIVCLYGVLSKEKEVKAYLDEYHQKDFFVKSNDAFFDAMEKGLSFSEKETQSFDVLKNAKNYPIYWHRNDIEMVALPKEELFYVYQSLQVALIRLRRELNKYKHLGFDKKRVIQERHALARVLWSIRKLKPLIYE